MRIGTAITPVAHRFMWGFISGLELFTRPPKPPLALLIIFDRLEEVALAEVRPEHLCKIELGVRHLPEEKIADPVFTAGPDKQIRIREPCGIEVVGKKFLGR